MAYVSWGIHVMATVEGEEKKKKAAWSAAAHLGGKDLSLWGSAYPSGFQPYRNSHVQFADWEEASHNRAYIEDYLGSYATAKIIQMQRLNRAFLPSSSITPLQKTNWQKAMPTNTALLRKQPTQ